MRLAPVLSALLGACLASINGFINVDTGDYMPEQLMRGLHQSARNGSARNSSSPGVYRLYDEYNYTNFWDKFTFFESNNSDPIGNPNALDPTHGYVLYQNRSEATRLGLVQTVGDVSILKVDDFTDINELKLGHGRRSVRVESKNSYNQGLFIVDFSHVPAPTCGIWPAFWSFAYEPGWPDGGEIDIYEQWNNNNFNRQSLHMNASVTGNCTLNTTIPYYMTNHIQTTNCNVSFADGNTACSTWDFEGPYGSATGGVYALEWTADALRLWTWHPGAAPADVVVGAAPDPSTWGAPGLVVAAGSGCDVGRTFANQTVVMNIDFCGDTAGSGAEWTASCAAETGYNSCDRYVAANPAHFVDVWFGVRTLKVYRRS